MNPRSGRRLFVLQVLVVSLFATLLARLWFLQVASGATYIQQATDNRVREVVTPAARGQIVDDVGRPLVANRTTLVVSIDRSQLVRQRDGGKGVLRRLAQVLGVPYDDVLRRTTLCAPGVPQPCWSGSPYQPIPVDNAATDAQALAVLEHSEDFPGVSAQPMAVRQYPGSAGFAARGAAPAVPLVNAAHVLGYLAPISDSQLADPGYAGYAKDDLVGASGLEHTYDRQLRGKPGVVRLSVDRNETVTGEIGSTPPVPGDTLVTSIDARVQYDVEVALARAVASSRQRSCQQNGVYSPCKADSAAGVVLDVKTGHVVALASYPSYDPAVWTGGISEAQYKALTDPAAGQPLLDRATQGMFAPGSTFKLVSSSAVVTAGDANFSSIYDCPPSYQIGNRTFSNFEGEAPGPVDLHTALVVSCDTIFYNFAYNEWLKDQAALRDGGKAAEVFVRMAQAYGLGDRTGIDVPGEAKGVIADRAYKRAFWEARKADYCAGAKNPAFTPDHRAADQEFCTDGWIYHPGDAANFAVGQGDTLVTPLQLATAYAALANGGTVFSPRIAKAVVGADGRVVQQVTAPVRGHLPVSAETMAQIRSAMADVIGSPRGTASGAFAGFPLDQVPLAGKTGTAEVTGHQDTSWFASFGPITDPRYVVLVTVSQAGQGALAAAPAVRSIWDGMYGLDGQPAALPGGLLPRALPPVPHSGTLPTAAPAAYEPGVGSDLLALAPRRLAGPVVGAPA